MKLKRMKLRKLVVSLGVAGALGVGITGQAQAGAMAQSLLEVTNFQLTNGTSALAFPTDVNVISFQDSLTNTASLTPGGADFHTTNQPGPPFVASVDAPAACVGACAPFTGVNENNFVTAAVPPGTTYSRSDSLLTGVPIVAPPIPLGANAHTIGETSLASNATGASTADILLTSSLTFTLAHDIGKLGITFSANDFLRAWTSVGSAAGSQAGAGLKWEITLAAGNTPLIDWIPNGAVNSGGTQTGLTELLDDCALNLNASAGANSPQAATANCSGKFSAVTNFALAAKDALGNPIVYSFTVDHHVSTQATSVPEPGTLALLGAALSGIGFAARRRNG